LKPRTRNVVLFASTTALAADPVIEFYNANLNHYFLTISASEASGIDSGAAGPGWHRNRAGVRRLCRRGNGARRCAPGVPLLRQRRTRRTQFALLYRGSGRVRAVKLDSGWR
jgi:hypothetical protein